jgi:AcrR family transcriptional regulator
LVKRGKVKKVEIAPKQDRDPALGATTDRPVRERVLRAAFAAFREHGYAGTSTLEIATRARASKRELYALFESKHAMLVECIAERAGRMRQPLQLTTPRDRQALAATLVAFGGVLLREVCTPNVLALYRLAIAEADRSPEVARALDEAGRGANHAALTALMATAQASGLVGAGEPAAMAARFFASLWGDLLLRLLLRVTEVPKEADTDARARAAADIVLKLYPEPAGMREA